MVQTIINRIIREVVKEIEKGVADLPGDSGGLTLFGISERYYPEFIARYRAGESEDKLYDDAIAIYRSDYMEKIYGWQWLAKAYPALLFLLFSGKVHGTGYSHYVTVLQEYLNNILPMKGIPLLEVDGILGPLTLRAVKEMTDLEREGFLHFLRRPQTERVLQQWRQKSVRAGGARDVDRGIANRVSKELTLALGVQQDAGFTQLAMWESQADSLEVKNNVQSGSITRPGRLQTA